MRRRFWDDMAFSRDLVFRRVPDSGPAELEQERRQRGGAPSMSGRAVELR
jgi:hypothetical protein